MLNNLSLGLKGEPAAEQAVLAGPKGEPGPRGQTGYPGDHGQKGGPGLFHTVFLFIFNYFMLYKIYSLEIKFTSFLCFTYFVKSSVVCLMPCYIQVSK